MSESGVEIIDHGWLRYRKQLKELNGSYIKFGFFAGEKAGFAEIVHALEMGSVRRISQKQFFFLRSKGMEVGTEIIIPERSFIRSSFDENLDQIYKWIETAFLRIGEGKSKKEALNTVAKNCKELILTKLKSGDFKENDPYTRERKGYDKKPLEDKGALQEGIDSVVSVK
ncbi:MAG: hypothetical protein B6241_12460 [Spirochaetaceae bacterium 4572_59]|nr:MAG: hypothetical protein B6241_12460 [Spirochaetaceae bacterium 4572_59]